MQTARKVCTALYCWSEFAVMAWATSVVIGLLVLITGPQVLAFSLLGIAFVAPPAARAACEGFVRLEPVLRRIMID